jgi:DNA helicase-2/ATP-dependent DNA helicase PcrA
MSTNTESAIFENLNPEQRQVVEHFNGPALVVAVAGSGKTRALCNRVAHLVEQGVNPRRILAVTFSKKAAGEMNERIRDLGVTACRVGTWHSVALQILKEERPDFNDWTIDTSDRFRIVVKKVLGYEGMNWTGADIGVVIQYIGLCKAELADPGTEKATSIAEQLFRKNPCAQTNVVKLTQAYFLVQESVEDRRILTFDDMLVECWRTLTNPETAARWSGNWDYVLQDEAQDQNFAQITLGEILAKGHGNYMLVGDPGQSIFGFRGAVPQKLLSFEADWGAKVIRMHRNYRCGKQIVEAANASIRSMTPGTHLGVELTGERGTEAKLTVKQYVDLDEEGLEVSRLALTHKEDGKDWGDMVVLYRVNSQSRAIEESFLSARIPYVVLGGTNFYERREVKDLLSYVRIAAGRATFEDVKRCINAPFRYLGTQFLNKIEESWAEQAAGQDDWKDAVRQACNRSGIQSRQRASADQWIDIISGLEESIRQVREANGFVDATTREIHGPAALFERVIKTTKYMEFLAKDNGAETVENNRVGNVRELVRAAERFTSIDELLNYIDDTLEKSADNRRERGDRVVLCSIHRSKGLEWPVVFITGVNQDLLPHCRAEDIGEERRLFYVGVTRAKDNLHLSYVNRGAIGNRVVHMAPSEFLNETGLL